MTKQIAVQEMTNEVKKPFSVPSSLKTPASPVKPTKNLRALAKTRNALILMLIIVAGLPSYYFYHQNQLSQARLKDPNTANQQVIDEVVKKVNHLILLPSGEQPTLASVSDVKKVQDQPFFQNAQNGDKVLVYTQARKAYLYRPSQNILIEVAPLNVSAASAAQR